MNEHFIKLGTVGSSKHLFGLLASDRRQHTDIVGATGVGKSALLRNMILQDIEAGQGVGILDPHGPLADDILHCIPPHRMRDVIYFNPADKRYTIGINLLRGNAENVDRDVIVSGVVETFQSIFRESWGPRLEYILKACIAALLDCDNASIFGIPRMLSDKRYRSWVVKQIKDPMVRSFWTDEFENYSRNFQSEAIAPVQNKIGQLCLSQTAQRVFSQVGTNINARFIMDNRKIFIANLSKGRLGKTNSNLIGAMLVTQFYLAAMGRENIPNENDRRDFFMFVDEFTNFATDSFANILSETRKYRLCLTVAHQYIGQVKEEVREAIFENIGSLIAFRVGHKSAEMLEKEFAQEYAARAFLELGNHEVYARLLNGGRYCRPFGGKTLAPAGTVYGRGKKILRQSRKKYGTEREIIEGKLNRWMKFR
jgi:hypothetical protein